MCLFEASLEELKCADCWPWEKYRQDGETERSPKLGPWQYPNFAEPRQTGNFDLMDDPVSK